MEILTNSLLFLPESILLYAEKQDGLTLLLTCLGILFFGFVTPYLMIRYWYTPIYDRLTTNGGDQSNAMPKNIQNEMDYANYVQWAGQNGHRVFFKKRSIR